MLLREPPLKRRRCAGSTAGDFLSPRAVSRRKELDEQVHSPDASNLPADLRTGYLMLAIRLICAHSSQFSQCSLVELQCDLMILPLLPLHSSSLICCCPISSFHCSVHFSLLPHYHLHLLLWCDQRNSRPQDIFSC